MNQLNVSSQVSLQTGCDGSTLPLTNSWCAQSMAALAGNNIYAVPNGVSPVPIGEMTSAQLEFLWIQNMDPAIAIEVSLNANGSAPFAQIGGGRSLPLPAMPGASYYFVLTGGPIEVQVLAVSS
jgi:hypothetical protein